MEFTNLSASSVAAAFKAMAAEPLSNGLRASARSARSTVPRVAITFALTSASPVVKDFCPKLLETTRTCVPIWTTKSGRFEPRARIWDIVVYESVGQDAFNSPRFLCLPLNSKVTLITMSGAEKTRVFASPERRFAACLLQAAVDEMDLWSLG